MSSPYEQRPDLENIVRWIKTEDSGCVLVIDDRDKLTPEVLFNIPIVGVRQGIPYAVGHLCSTLLEIGGESIKIFFENDPWYCAWLASDGVLMSPQEVVMMSGEPNRCHDNAENLWLESPDKYTLVSGFAFAEDRQMWFYHSWLLDMEGRIVETTVKFDHYFGLVPHDFQMTAAVMGCQQGH